MGRFQMTVHSTTNQVYIYIILYYILYYIRLYYIILYFIILYYIYTHNLLYNVYTLTMTWIYLYYIQRYVVYSNRTFHICLLPLFFLFVNSFWSAGSMDSDFNMRHSTLWKSNPSVVDVLQLQQNMFVGKYGTPKCDIFPYQNGHFKVSPIFKQT